MQTFVVRAVLIGQPTRWAVESDPSSFAIMLIFFNIQLKTYLFFAGYLTLERLYSSTVLWNPVNQAVDNIKSWTMYFNVLVQMQPRNMTTGASFWALLPRFFPILSSSILMRCPF